MKSYAIAWRFFSSFFLLFSVFLFLPAAVSIGAHHGSILGESREPLSFLIPILLLLVMGFIFRLPRFSLQKSIEINIQSGFFIVTICWVLSAGIGCLPFLIGIEGISFTDAYFEAMSGFTTTGATVITDVEALEPGLGLWRCMTQWIGGMGIIILFLAVLPTMVGGGYSLFCLEVPGGTMVERIKPRIAETAKSLWKVYLLFSVIECLLLWLTGMPFYDAVCHTFTTMPTGGFSIKNQGIAAYDNFWIELIITFFMLAAGVSFSLHYRFFHGSYDYFRNSEFKVYIFIIIFSVFVIFATLLFHSSSEDSISGLMRQSIFQVVSIVSTTGFATVDYNQWPEAAKLFLLLLFFTGGCVGSTGGSIKVFRHLILVKSAIRQLKSISHPMQVFPVKIDQKSITNESIMGVFNFVIIFIGLFFLGALCLAMTDLDIVAAFGGAAAAIGNIGPALGAIGPASTYAFLAPFAKWVLIFLMLLGRLELLTVLAFLLPFIQKTKINSLNGRRKRKKGGLIYSRKL